MKNHFRLVKLSALCGLAMAFGLNSCKNELESPKSAEAEGTSDATLAVVTVGTCGANTLISSNTTWSSSNTYVIRGNVRIVNSSTLTIEKGTVIKGECGANLIIERNANINAAGTPSFPIVFTSNQPANRKTRGFWGGVVILGNGITNQGTKVPVEGITSTTGTDYGFYGGTNNADNSGKFQYVRIEYPGTEVSEGNEINGLTLGGVGSGTIIDHVQVLYSQDDGFEFFGGAVNPRYLYAFGNSDDDFDTDFGYVGKVQFAVGVKTTSSEPGAGASNGFESDNDATGTTATPRTNPRFANVTLVGPCSSPGDPAVFGQAMLLRRNSQLDIYNSVISHWNNAITIQAPSVAGNPGVDLKSIYVYNNGILSPSPLYNVSRTSQEPRFSPCPIPCYSTASSIASGSGPKLIPSSDVAGTTPPGVGFAATSYRGAFSANASNNDNWNLRSENANFQWLSFPCEGFSAK
jgi:hypothetical protein